MDSLSYLDYGDIRTYEVIIDAMGRKAFESIKANATLVAALKSAHQQGKLATDRSHFHSVRSFLINSAPAGSLERYLLDYDLSDDGPKLIWTRLLARLADDFNKGTM
ncbi:MAG: hypothetical protein NZ959_10425 [Armatimonadetes bacterium]|nr:hypothetical protein [Armatimonadota bacterium]MDW8122710.1 hypothetical protein [Armatimonadota bacterium]